VDGFDCPLRLGANSVSSSGLLPSTGQIMPMDSARIHDQSALAGVAAGDKSAQELGGDFIITNNSPHHVALPAA